MRQRTAKTIVLSMAFGFLFPGAGLALAAGGIQVHRVNKAISLDPFDPVWKGMAPYPVTLVPQTIALPRGGGSVSRLQVQAIHNQQQVAIRLTWKDTTEDLVASVDRFRDAVAIMFPVNQENLSRTSPLMGGKDHPVNIWQWRADWQAQVDGRNRMEQRQPLTAGVWISPLDQNIVKTRFPAKPSPDAVAIEYIAEGWGTLTRQKSQDIKAKGVYRNGEWTVVFVRSIDRTDPSDAAFAPGTSSAINFAVWNGSRAEVSGRKAMTMAWTPLVFD